MRTVLAVTLCLACGPALAQAELAPDASFEAFAAECRTNIGVREECQGTVIEAARTAFGTDDVICHFPALWAVADGLTDPPAGERKWQDVVQALAAEGGVCAPDRPAS